MATNNVLLTGGTGFFGRALLRYYFNSPLKSDTKLTIVSRNPTRFRNMYPELTLSSSIRLIEGDIDFPETLPSDEQYTHILHAATDSTLGPNLNSLKYYKQIVSGVSNLLDFAVQNNVPKFLLTSSGGIYGAQPNDLDRLSEDYLGSPPLMETTAAYSHGKRAAEHLSYLYSANFGINITIARCFAFVGQDLPLDAHFAIGNFLLNALNSTDLIIKGDGTAIRSYLDQRDLALWLWTLLFHGKNQEVYNVGSDEEISIYSLACLIRDLISPKSNVLVLGKRNTVSFRNRYVPDISKFKSDFSLQPKYTLRDAIYESVRKLQ